MVLPEIVPPLWVRLPPHVLKLPGSARVPPFWAQSTWEREMVPVAVTVPAVWVQLAVPASL